MSDQTAIILLVLLLVVFIFVSLLVMVVPDVRDFPSRRRYATIVLTLCVVAGLAVMIAYVGLDAIRP
jgi:hypothetical protein